MKVSKKILYPALSLFLITLVSVILLALTNAFTKDKIKDANRSNEDKQRIAVFPDAESFREKENYTECLDGDKNIIGYIFVTKGAGYSGDITVMTGIDKDGVISGVKVLEHTETPTFGGVAVENNFTDEYKGKEAQTFVKGQNIDGWTGATKTTNGVIEAVNLAVGSFETVAKGGAENG